MSSREALRYRLLARKHLCYKKKNHFKFHQFYVVILIFLNISNCIVLSKRQDEELQPELELDFSLFR